MDPTGPLRGQNESRVLRPHVAQRLLAFLGLDGKVSEELLLLSLSFSLSPDVVVVATTTTKAATVVVQLSFSRSSRFCCLESTLGFQDQNQVMFKNEVRPRLMIFKDYLC